MQRTRKAVEWPEVIVKSLKETAPLHAPSHNVI